MNNSRNANINVNKIPSAGLIETEGWVGEYPYFYFDFTQRKGKWVWLGVCYDSNRSLDFAMNRGGEDKLYDGMPQLPRRDPRTIEDPLVLRARIEEVLRFKAFDALKPYAIKENLIFEECSREIIEKNELKGKEISFGQVIDFLKNNASTTKWNQTCEGTFLKIY